MLPFRSDIQTSDHILIRNICKDKRLPGTKTQPKYFGPYPVEKVTKGHIVVSKDAKKSKHVPLHLAKKYMQCNTQV